MNVTLVPEHIVPEGDAAIETDAVPVGPTAIIIVSEVAGEPVAHARLEFMMQVMESLSASDEDEYVEFVSPEIFDPFNTH